jgi:hypothetical protein
MGARPLSRLIDTKIKSPLSRKVLFGELQSGGIVNVTLNNNELVFSISEMPIPLTKEERKLAKKAIKEEAATVVEVQNNNS